MITIKLVLFFIGLSAAAWIDRKTFTIPNWLTASMIAVGLFFGFFPDGSFFAEAGLVRMMESAIIFVLVLLPFLLGRAWLLPGGDGKLFIAITAFTGISFAVYAILAGLIVAVLEAVFIGWKRKMTIKELRQLQIPLAPSILMGVFFSMVFLK
ncbi:prepilin peptidase [Heliorestis convoluta]|uniref:Prepilin peptidase protein n=1 Tax=Heliorestis convoluta TaxID=356322 RepID=A0A5Q2MYW7_9FIRM|nr:prepilin peptidase [Heliorestis convoluta]QGG46356.1 prepilin peptidase protein [Heliorestis convoluta]